MNKVKRTISIPFDGFYCSIVEHLIDWEIESVNEWQVEQGLEPYSDQSIDWETIARKWVDCYNEWLLDEHELDLESLKFDRLTMPKFYNFETDQIYCKLSAKDAKKLYSYSMKDKEAFQSKVNAMYSSRDGFASFYDAFVTEWRTKPLTDWDVNELASLLPVPTDFGILWDLPNTNGQETIRNAIHFIE